MPEHAASTGGPITINRTSPVPLYFQLARLFESAVLTLPRPSAIPH